MKDLHTFRIIINDLPLKDNYSYVHVLLKDEKGKIIKTVTEHALLHDKDFRDISGLYIGLKEAAQAKAERILILTDNPLLGAIIKGELKSDCGDYYGFDPDIEHMVAGFEKVKMEIVSRKSLPRYQADHTHTDFLSLGIHVPKHVFT
jgi:hypothetical protein